MIKKPDLPFRKRFNPLKARLHIFGESFRKIPRRKKPRRNMKDKILRALWKTKDQMAKEYGYDIGKLVKELRRKEREETNKVVDLSKEIRKAS